MSKQEIEKAAATLIQEEDLPTPEGGDWGGPEPEPEPTSIPLADQRAWHIPAIQALQLMARHRTFTLPPNAVPDFIQSLYDNMADDMHDGPRDYVDQIYDGCTPVTEDDFYTTAVGWIENELEGP